MVVPIVVCLLATVVLHGFARRFFPLVGLLDFPGHYGLKRRRLPYPTGIIALLVFLGEYAFLEPPSLQKTGLLLAIAALGIVTFYDDRAPLSPFLRLSVHILCAFLVFATGTRIYTLTNPVPSFLGMGDILKLDTLDFQTSLFGPLPVFSGIFTILWLGITINALNWFDGIPGQVSIISVIAFATIGFLSLSDRVNQPHLALLAFVLAAVALGSAVFDFPPPRVVLGDTGAMFFGLMIGVLTIYSGGKVATAFLVLGVPIFDFLFVIARRVLRGTSVVHGSTTNEHLHHRLLARGWSPRAIIALTAVIGSAFGVTALFLSTTGKFLAALLLGALMLTLSAFSRPLPSSRR